MTEPIFGGHLDEVAGAVAGLDMLLTDAAVGPMRRIVAAAGASMRVAVALSDGTRQS